MRTVQVVATASAVALTMGVVAVLGVSFASAGTTPARPAVVAVDPAPAVTVPVTPAPTVAPTTAPAVPVAPAPAPAPVNNWAPGQAPKGTPLPHHTETDPNNGNYGQQTYDDPATFCASLSGSTINGVPECD